MSARQYLRLAHSDARAETPEGTWIVADPTGRDLNDCLEVGRVVKALIRNEDGDDCALVLFNGHAEPLAVTEVRVVLQGG